jgi:hypothetical protein
MDSIEIPKGDRCIDILLQPDGNYEFEIYRRDEEFLTGWFPITRNIGNYFLTKHSARQAVYNATSWVDPNKT